nr:integrase, catalytic region, zinc finger, CCHC-type, peptidase aspartic, catalytic [Tanacetum cinerariifolium]
MTGDRSQFMNFVKKFIETVRFRNDHFGAIMGYGDYVIGESVISRVYYVEGLGHNLFSVGKFCDFDLEVAFKKHSCYVRDTDVSPTPYVPPSKKDYEILFQPLFDEYFNRPLRDVSPVPVAVAAPRVVDLTGSPSSTITDQEVPTRAFILTPGYISSGLVQNSISPTPYVPLSKKDYEILFQPLFDEYFNRPPRDVSPV